jgi:excisionase family DNA binding protein
MLRSVETGPGASPGERPGPPPGEAGEWVTVEEAARRLGVAPKTVRDRIEDGKLVWRPRGNRGRDVWVPEVVRPREDPGAAERLEAGLAEARALAERWRSEAEAARIEAAALRAAGEGRERLIAALEGEVAWLRDRLGRPWWRRGRRG